MSITREQAAEWFETMHPPGPAAREMYRMAAEALRAQVVVDDSLAPRSAFSDVDGYIEAMNKMGRETGWAKRKIDSLLGKEKKGKNEHDEGRSD